MPRLTPALLRGLDILELVGDHDDPLTFADIVARSELPRASVHELVHTLTERGYLEKVGTGYRLGVRLFRLGMLYGDRVELVEIAQRIAHEVAAATTETVSVGQLHGADVFYICKVDAQHQVRMPSKVGVHLPANCTSVGKALLAYLDPAVLRSLYPDPQNLPRLTDASIGTLDELEDDLHRTRERGYSLEHGEAADNLICCGAPVRDRDGNVVASISTSVPEMRWHRRSEQEWAATVTAGARTLSELLGAPAP